MSSSTETTLIEIERRVLWLATRMIDAANRGRATPEAPPGREAEFHVKVGGHQASSCVDGRDHDGAVVRSPPRRRQGGGQTPCISGVPRDQVPHRRARSRRISRAFETSEDFRRTRSGRRIPTSPTSRPGRLASVRRPRSSPPPRAGTSSPISDVSDQPAEVHLPRRRRRARRGQHLGGDHRSGSPGTRQRDVGRRREPAEPRSRDPGDEDAQADAVLRESGWHVVEAKYGAATAAPRSSDPAVRRCADTSTRCRTRSTSRCSGSRGGNFVTDSAPERDDAVRAALDDVHDDDLAGLIQNLGGHDHKTSSPRSGHAMR